MKPTYEQLEQQLLEQAVQLTNAESKCRELAAELHSVKSAHQDAVDTIMNTASKGVVIYTKKPIQIGVTTPIHDFFLAEVRAQGVDYAIDHLNKIFDAKEDIGEPIRALEWLAQAIRKGGEA